MKTFKNEHMKTRPSGVTRGEGEQVGACTLGRRPWGCNSTFFAVILNVFLSINLDKSMLKNAYILGKNGKNHLRVMGSAPEPPFTSGGWGLTNALLYSCLLLQLCWVCFQC